MGESCVEKFILLGRSNVVRLIDSLDSQRRDGRFCDVVLKLDDDSFLAAHASVLSACSSYIYELVSQERPRKCSEENPQVIELSITPSEYTTPETLFINLLQLVEHFYGRNLSINGENCHNICALASFFQADDIVRQCEEFISTWLSRETNELTEQIVDVQIDFPYEENENIASNNNNNDIAEIPVPKGEKRPGTILQGALTPKRKNTRTVVDEPVTLKVTKQSPAKKAVTRRLGEVTPKKTKGRPTLKLKIRAKVKRLGGSKVGRPRSDGRRNSNEILEDDTQGENLIEQKCKKCDFRSPSAKILRNHSLTHYGRPYVCRSCGYRVKQPSYMVKHLLDSKDCPDHQIGTVCSVCDDEMTSNEELQEHYKLHDQKKPFLCSICELRFPFKSALFLHKTTHVDDRMFICGTCGRTFKTKYSLQNHMIVHETNKKFLCDQCGYITAYKASLEAHSLIHTGNTLKCKYPGCSFEAVRTSNLNEHMLTHSKEKPYQCEVCGQAFSRAKHLRRHSYMHGGTNLPAHACPLCNFTSYRSDKVKVHLRKHHPEDSYLPVATTTISSPLSFTSTFQHASSREQVPYPGVSAEILLQQALNTITSVQQNSYIGPPVISEQQCETIEHMIKLSPTHH